MRYESTRGTSAAIVLAAIVGSGSLRAQASPRIVEVRKVATLSDGDGRSFTHPPNYVAKLRAGQFLIVERDKPPVVVDSTGKPVRLLGRMGQGPGEFTEPGAVRLGAGDTLFIRNIGVSVFSPTFVFSNTVRLVRDWVDDFLVLPTGFVAATPLATGAGTFSLLHTTTRDGALLRSFAARPLNPRHGGLDGRYALAPSGADAFWAAPYLQHRFERWKTDGTLISVIDTVPDWYWYASLDENANTRSVVRAMREIEGRLWVMSSVPVPNADSIVKAATGRRVVIEDGNRSRFPVERLTTTMIEAYDVRSGKIVAQLHLAAYGVGFVDDAHIATYAVNADDLAQLNIWEIRIRR